MLILPKFFMRKSSAYSREFQRLGSGTTAIQCDEIWYLRRIYGISHYKLKASVTRWYQRIRRLILHSTRMTWLRPCQRWDCSWRFIFLIPTKLSTFILNVCNRLHAPFSLASMHRCSDICIKKWKFPNRMTWNSVFDFDFENRTKDEWKMRWHPFRIRFCLFRWIHSRRAEYKTRNTTTTKKKHSFVCKTEWLCRWVGA